MTTTIDHGRKIREGVAFLDEWLGPQWPHDIDLDRLNLSSACRCVLGQLALDIATAVLGGIDEVREHYGCDVDGPASDAGAPETAGRWSHL